MRDYKQVKAPRSFRLGARGPKVLRADAGGAVGRSGKRAGAGTIVLRFLAVVLIVLSVWFGRHAYQQVTHAKMFQITGVDVEGAGRVSEADLRRITAGITGRNIFRVDLESAIEGARAHAWVREARISRRLPNRIRLVIRERVPAVILDSGRGRYLVENDGTVIERLKGESEAAWRLPVVETQTGRDVRVRPGLQVTAEALQGAFELLHEITLRGGWNPAEVMIRANSPESLAVLYAGREFKMGSGNYGEKFRRLAEVMEDVKQRNLDFAYVDLRPERQAAVMVRKK